MLSTKQKKLRDLNKPTVSGDLSYSVRKLSSDYDKDRVSELWANLTMIQQMQGNNHWLEQSKKSGLEWKDFVRKLLRTRSARVIIFENTEEIFGFAYLTLEPMNINNPKVKTQLKAIIKELYLEPAYRKQSKESQMAEMMRDTIKSMGVEFVEFDVKDLNL